MEIKEDMYLRYKGQITKVEKVKGCLIEFEKAIYEEADEKIWYITYNDIFSDQTTDIHYSYNIIDLIKIGDVIVVDGIKYTILQNKEHCNNILHIKTIDNKYSTIKYLFEQNKIESIVTKEQFELWSYKVEE